MNAPSAGSPGLKALPRPHGLLLYSLRLPVWLYRLHLGWLLGDRFLMLTHTGRRSGKTYRTVIEVVKHERGPDSFFVVSGWGQKADWYQNVHQSPDVTITVGRHRQDVRAEDIPLPDAINILEEYTRRHPLAFKELTRLFMGEQLRTGRESSQRLAERMPMVVFRPSATSS